MDGSLSKISSQWRNQWWEVTERYRQGACNRQTRRVSPVKQAGRRAASQPHRSGESLLRLMLMPKEQLLGSLVLVCSLCSAVLGLAARADVTHLVHSHCGSPVGSSACWLSARFSGQLFSALSRSSGPELYFIRFITITLHASTLTFYFFDFIFRRRRRSGFVHPSNVAVGRQEGSDLVLVQRGKYPSVFV